MKHEQFRNSKGRLKLKPDYNRSASEPRARILGEKHYNRPSASFEKPSHCSRI